MKAIAAGCLAVVIGIAFTAKARDRHSFSDYLAPLGRLADARIVQAILAGEAVLALALALSAVWDPARPPVAAATTGFVLASTTLYAGRLSFARDAGCPCFGGRQRPGTPEAPLWYPAFFALRNATIGAVAAWVANAAIPVIASVAIAVVGAVAIGVAASIVQEHRHLALELHPATERFAPTMATLQAHTWWVNGHPREF